MFGLGSRNAAFFTAALILGAAFVRANAAPPVGQPVDPDMQRWYKSLRQPNTGAGCCSIADCRSYTSRIIKDHYEILVQDRWFSVPNAVVLHQENKAGSAIACLRTLWNHDFSPAPADYSPDVLCFVPGPEA
jgi:hypothetical protein